MLIKGNSQSMQGWRAWTKGGAEGTEGLDLEDISEAESINEIWKSIEHEGERME